MSIVNRHHAKCGALVLLLGYSAISTTLAQSTAQGCSTYSYATDSRVFNWRFYLNANADLSMAGYRTPEQACSHWVSSGVNEGRQAHGGFHTAQYLKRYTDLAQALGLTNFSAATWHWVTYGVNEGRKGYLDNHIANEVNIGNTSGQLHTTIQQDNYGGGKIFVSASLRAAGAMSSLIVNNFEYINAYDHGREMQIALVDNTYGQGYNPTEAGTCLDDIGYSTKSRYLSSSAFGSTMSFSNTPAFWETPGDTGPCVSVYNTPAHNSSVYATGYTFNKTVQIGTQVGTTFYPNIIRFTTALGVNDPYLQGPYITLSAPATYLGAEFDRAYVVNPKGTTATQSITQGSVTIATLTIPPNSISEISNYTCFTSPQGCNSAGLPIVLSKGAWSTSANAIGICTTPPTSPGYGGTTYSTSGPAGGSPQQLNPTSILSSNLTLWAGGINFRTTTINSYVTVAARISNSYAADQVKAALVALTNTGLCSF